MSHYLPIAAAYVRGARPDAPALPEAELVAWARAEGLRMHRYTRKALLPRVRRVLGLLQGIWPAELLDVGPGRGAALWPLLDAFPQLPVTAVEASPERARQLRAVSEGGIDRLTVLHADARDLPLGDRAVDVVTALEVIEHIPEPAAALAELARVGRRFLVVTVPSKPDDNPEHLHYFEAAQLQAMLLEAGAASVKLNHVLNHRVALARLSP